MKTLILYATKYGATREIAHLIAKAIRNEKNTEVHDLKQGNALSVSEFDCVIIGSSLYAGMIRKEAKVFLSRSAELICAKKVGIFLSGLESNADKIKASFETNFSSEFLQSAKIKSFLGGIYDPKKAGVMERFIFKAATKQSNYTNTIDKEKISQFAENIMK